MIADDGLTNSASHNTVVTFCESQLLRKCKSGIRNLFLKEFLSDAKDFSPRIEKNSSSFDKKLKTFNRDIFAEKAIKVE